MGGASNYLFRMERSPRIGAWVIPALILLTVAAYCAWRVYATIFARATSSDTLPVESKAASCPVQPRRRADAGVPIIISGRRRIRRRARQAVGRRARAQGVD